MKIGEELSKTQLSKYIKTSRQYVNQEVLRHMDKKIKIIRSFKDPDGVPVIVKIIKREFLGKVHFILKRINGS